MVQIRFWWRGYSPEDALSSLDFSARETPFEVSEDRGITWRFPRPGTTLETVNEWMVDRGLTVRNTAVVDHRRIDGSWEGQYVLTFGPKYTQGGQRCSP